MNLEEALTQYKDTTLSLIQFVEKEHYDYIENALNNRQKIIDEVNLMNYTNDQFKEIAIELKLYELEKQLAKIMGEKKDKIKEKMLELKKSQNVNNAYRHGIEKSYIFSKKV